MLTTEEFRAWCQRLQISPETEAFITRIRSSPPIRKVRGRANNVSGKYPSPKMQRSIQFESQYVELWGCYGMERDDDVLEYYDQSACIPLRYQTNSGRSTTQWHVPDFFVLRRASAGFEEWKHAKELNKLEVSNETAISAIPLANGVVHLEKRTQRLWVCIIGFARRQNTMRTTSRM